MECFEEDTVQAFAEARLSAAAVAEIEAHTRGCVSCEELLAAALRLPGLARTAPTQHIGRPERPGLPRDHSAEGAVSPRDDHGAALAVGTSIDRYTVLGLVGRGGMGEVYAAYDPSLDRRVALKLMGSRIGERALLGQERLLREARAIARLTHPNVVVVYEVGTYRGRVFISMEFVEGMTLAAWLEAGVRSWQEIVDVFVQAARGLAAAHVAGLVHRDFKPQNVMVARDGTARVTDFGLARDAEVVNSDSPRQGRGTDAPASISSGMTLTETGQHIGTPLFMAPEQFTNGPIDARTDQFSFCVALYWALYGAHPFGGVSVAELAKARSSKELASPRGRGMAPAWVRAVLARGLNVSPGERWPSMDALVAKLSEDPARRRRRRVGLAVGAMTACLAIGATSGLVSGTTRARCSEGGKRLLGVWEPNDVGAASGVRRAQVRASIMSSGIPDPATLWSSVSSILDAHASKWQAMYRDACEATYVRGEQSDDAFDLRMTCLSDDLESVQAVTALLTKRERSVIEHGVEAVGSLGDLQRCAAIDQLRSEPRLPKDPFLRRKVGDLKQRLKEGEAYRFAGRIDRAVDIADAVLSESERIRYAPLQAEALFLKGLSMAMAAFSDAAISTLEQALTVAEGCGHDRVVAGAAAVLVSCEGAAEPRLGERWARIGRSALLRMGGDPLIEGWLEQDIGDIRWEQHRWNDAAQHFARAMALKEKALGREHADVAMSASNLGLALSKLGRHREGLAAADEALAVLRRWFGREAPLLFHCMALNAEVHQGAGDYETAVKLYLQVIDFMKKAVLGTPKWEAMALKQIELRATTGLGESLIALGRSNEGLQVLEEAVREGEDAQVDQTGLAEARFALAKTLNSEPENAARVRMLARQALTVFGSREGFEVRQAEIERWMASATQVREPHSNAD